MFKKAHAQITVFALILSLAAVTLSGISLSKAGDTSLDDEEFMAKVEQGIEEYIKKQRAAQAGGAAADSGEPVEVSVDDDAFKGDKNAPVTIVEMAASGMPIVSSKHCDIPHVVIDGQTGWLAEERDVHGLVEHLKWLVDHPHTWRTFTDRGRKHIEENFDVRVQASLLEKIYCQVISEQ